MSPGVITAQSGRVCRASARSVASIVSPRMRMSGFEVSGMGEIGMTDQTSLAIIDQDLDIDGAVAGLQRDCLGLGGEMVCKIQPSGLGEVENFHGGICRLHAR